MCYKIAVLALVALNALAITALPPCVCTRNLRPVCGSDGNTYSNECLLNCENHKTGGHITMEKEGPCSDAIKVAQPPCTCTEELDYVCGSDGNTYGNPCQLNCATANNPSLGVKNHGRCDDSVKVANPEPPTPGCFCTYEYNPTCGSDGETYSNPCQLNCATANNPSLRVQHEGSCGHVNVVNPEPSVPPCICTLDYKPVCGSDGETYSNPCQLNCATANNPSLRVQNEGSCGHVNVVNPEPSSVPACICTLDYKPICGSDGETYSNPCQLNCATASNPSLRVQHEGSCGHVNVVNPEPSVPPCICTDDLNEVCGSDGVTYGNPCQLNCATAHNPSLGVQKQGRCESQGHPQGCTCPRDMQPVCGSDGVTYNNMCLLRCAGSHVSLARLAPCELRN